MRTIAGDIRKLQLMSVALFAVLALSFLSVMQFTNSVKTQKTRLLTLSNILQERLIEQGIQVDRQSLEELHSQIEPITLSILKCYDNSVVGGFYSRRYDQVVVGQTYNSSIDIKGSRMASNYSGHRSWITKEPELNILWSPLRKTWIIKCDNPVVVDGKVVGHTFANVAMAGIIATWLRMLVGTFAALVLCVVLIPIFTRRFLARIEGNLGAFSSLSREDAPMPKFDYESFTAVAEKIKKSYTALLNSHRYQESLLDNFPWGYMIVDSMGNFTKVNLNGQKILGVTSKQLADVKIEDRVKHNSPIMRALREKTRIDTDISPPFVHSGKTIRMTAFPTVFPDGSEGAMAWFVDVTESVNAQRTIELATKQKAEMLDSCPWGYLILDDRGICIESNEEGARLVGMTRDALLGMDLPDSGGGIRELCKHVLDDQAVVSDELTTSVLGTDSKIFNVCCFPVTLGSGKMGAMAWFQDITEQRQMQLKVQHMDRLSTIGEMISIVSHDIRNPLTAIKTKAQLAALMPDKIEHVDEWRKIDNLVDNINQYLDRVLSYCKPSNSAFAVCSIKELYDNVVSILNSKIRHSNVKLTAEIDTPVPVAFLNPLEFQHIILNLINNAIEAISGAGEVTFSCRNEGNFVKISLKDTGCGIPDEDLPKIWKMYYTTKPTGNGIGLAMAKKVIEQIGGSIQVSSKVGQGTCFTILLPRPQAIVSETA